MKKKEIDFDSLSNKEQRLLILKDVVKSIKLQNSYKFSKGNILKVEGTRDYITDSLKTLLPEIKKCEVCIRGGLLLSKVKFNGDCTFDTNTDVTAISNGYINKYLEKTFTKEELIHIEVLFESSCYDSISIPFDYKILYKLEFNKKVELLVNFMIKNNGIFEFDKFEIYYPKTKIWKENLKER